MNRSRTVLRHRLVLFRKVLEQRTARAAGTKPDVTGRSSASLRHPIQTFCFQTGKQAPGQLARPYLCAFALPRGSTSGVEPATAPVWGEERPGYGTYSETYFIGFIQKFRVIISRRIVSSETKVWNRGSNPQLCNKAEPETTRSNARLRHLNHTDSAEVGRATQ
jgi:hypothetical protein